MRVLVLGATGTLGHRVCMEWGERFECFGTVREPAPQPAAELLRSTTLISGVTADDSESLRPAFEAASPDVVVNCIGAVKQAAAGQEAVPAIRVNSLFPHELAGVCREFNARMVHVSTDCVFSGSRGNYSEDDVPDASDIYGRSKLLGEVSGDGLLTLRTSLIGRELRGTLGLLEWLISNRGGQVRGFRRAVFSGFTTKALAGEIAHLISEHPELDGIWHLAAQPIDKLDLLERLNRALELEIEIVPDADVVIDRSLDSGRLRSKTGREPRGWDEMIDELAADETPYDQIRRELGEQ